MSLKSTSLRVYVALLVTLVILRATLAFVPAEYVVSAQASVSTWLALIAVSVLGFVGLRLSSRTGFPDIWDGNASCRRILLAPFGLGSSRSTLGLSVQEAPICRTGHDAPCALPSMARRPVRCGCQGKGLSADRARLKRLV